jgi:predicted phosphodiesterase
LRVVQLSDFHYAPSTAADRGLEHAERLVERLHPDLIVVSGDLTREGLIEQFLPVIRFLERLGMERVRAIPGNRDYPASRPTMPRPVDSDLHYFLAAPDTAEVENEAPGVTMNWTLFTEFFPALDVFERHRGLTFVALNSEPNIADDSMDRAINYFDSSSPAVPRLFCTHRSLLPSPGKRIKEGDLLQNAGDILQRLLGARVNVALCAHLHRVNTWRIADNRRWLTVVNAPSLLDTSGGKLNGLISLDLDEAIVVTFHPLDGSESRELIRDHLSPAQTASVG